MNILEIKEKLEIKPIVQKNEGVKITLALPKTFTNKTQITEEKDDGKKAQSVLERLKKHNLSKITIKEFQIEENEPVKTNKSNAVTIQPIKKASKKKLGKITLIEEPEEIELLPEGGPRLDEGNPIESEIIELPQITKKRISKKMPKGIIPLGPEAMIQIGDTSLPNRLPLLPVYNIKTSSYYMNNREIFVNFINNLFEPYKDDLLDESKQITCENIGKDTGEIDLLIHQKIVKDYINLYTPYRGLLLFHGLGSGKTCTSIAVAEGLKNSKKVIVMTPASLKRNYLEEIKKCGDLIYRKKQFWEWISTDENPEYIDSLSSVLSLPREYIRRKHGVWLVNITKPNNYDELTTSHKKSLNDQLDEMIQNKYTFINYNGLRTEKFRELTNNYDNNIFDNSVIIIDEAHNLISRIVNKINKMKKFSQTKRGPDGLIPIPLALQLYEFLLRSENSRIVLLTGTPIINYPNEISILFNILRGYIKTWNFTLNIEGSKKVTRESLQDIFFREKVLDYVDYTPSSKTLTITRNPYGFENKITESSGYKGVTNQKRDENTNKITTNERGQISDEEFIKRIVKILKNNDISVIERTVKFDVNTSLPDTMDEFVNNFIDKNTGNVNNIEKFKRRIIGLTSYFRSAQEELLPRYDYHFDKHEVFIPMSNYQFQIYEEARQEERLTEKPGKSKGQTFDKDGLFVEPTSTYRIFSRLFCNFVMPKPPGRPKPSNFVVKKMDEKEKGDKQLLKADAKAEKERLKAEAKAEKERLKAEAKDEKERLKAEAKAEKARLKAAAKAKGVDADDDSNSVTDSPTDTDTDDNDVNDESDTETHVKRDDYAIADAIADEIADAKYPDHDKTQYGGANPLDEFIAEKGDDFISFSEYKDEDANLRDVDEIEGDELLEIMGNVEYKTAIQDALKYLKRYKTQYLSPEGLKIYSPKFLTMLENIDDSEHRGLHLVYSQFRSMEGIGIFALVLEANGYARFKIKKTGADSWQLDMSEDDIGKPTYALYTGTEEADEREIIRNIYNGSWENIPNNIASQLRNKSLNNNFGEIIKVLMITSAGSEGINLRNTRYVHIMEPYWHPVRTQQVIGRARRICSHQSLPVEFQTVEVFIYIMTFTKEQLDSDYAIELRISDQSKIAPFLPQSSDEKLYQISTIKEQISEQLLRGVKEASIDCATHIKSSTSEGLTCLSFGRPTVNDFSFNPNYTQDESDTVAAINRIAIDWEAKEFTFKKTGKKYFLRMDTKQVYDYNSVLQAKEIPGVRPILIGKLVKNSNGEYEIIKDRL